MLWIELTCGAHWLYGPTQVKCLISSIFYAMNFRHLTWGGPKKIHTYLFFSILASFLCEIRWYDDLQNDYIDNRLQKGAKKSQIRMNSASKVWFGKKVRNQMIYHNVTTYLLLWDDIKYVKCVFTVCSSTIFFHKLLYIYQVIELETFFMVSHL